MVNTQSSIQSEFKTLENESNAIEEAVRTEALYEMRAKELRLQEKSEFLEFRKNWSQRLLLLIVFIVVFNAFFLIIIGLDVLTYQDEWLVRIIFLTGFMEVLGLGKVVVEFLFKEPPKLKTSM